MTEERLGIPADGITLAAVLHLPASGRGPWPCVVTAHGLLSSKDSDKYLLIAAEFAQAGFGVCRFDFRGCGDSGGTLLETTVAQRVSDMHAVLERMRKHPALDGRLGLLGSSLGGFVSLFVAHEDPDVKGLAAWATPAELDDLGVGPEAVAEYGLGQPFVADLQAGRYLRAPGGTRACLFIHGDRDDVVPVEHARRLYAAAREPKRLAIIPGGDHPLTDLAHRREAVQMSLEWIRRFL
jgi:fermentation-respiration switch protein FrsA (DUF1100 family)